MNIIQVNGIKGTHLFDVYTKGKVRASAADDEIGRIDLMVGKEEISIYLTKDWVVGKEESNFPVTVEQFKLEESE